jgi:hypothetical protein
MDLPANREIERNEHDKRLVLEKVLNFAQEMDGGHSYRIKTSAANTKQPTWYLGLNFGFISFSFLTTC